MSQQSNQDPEAQVKAAIKKLAGRPCPRAHEGHDGYLASDGSGLPCSDCGGTGARFKWLWLECSRCHGDGVKPDGFGTGTVRCGLCDGRGWVPNYDIQLGTAVAMLPASIATACLDEWFARLKLLKQRTSKSVELAFWQAVEKAVSNA